MAMLIGKQPQAQINVTPMIDVLLVLLILFMIVTPAKQVGLDTLVPQPAAIDQPTRNSDLVIYVKSGGRVELNHTPMPAADLPQRLLALYHGRPDAPIFIGGDKELEFRDVGHVIDLVKGTGATRIGLLPGNSLQ